VLVTVAIILVVLAVLGGIVVHPLLFLLAVLAAVALFSARRGTHGHLAAGRRPTAL
jgi:flagellar biosynthesis component FlhA